MPSASGDNRGPDGLTPLHRASIAGDIDACLRCIDDGADVNAPSGTLLDEHERATEGTYAPGDTPLILAARAGASDVVALLVGRGADPARFNAQRWGPLHSAVVGGNLRTLDILVRAGAELELSCIGREFDEALGWFFVGTALHVAASWNRADIADGLIRAGANVSAAWIDRRTPLIYAAARGSTAVVDVLCRHGADPNIREHRHEYGTFVDMTPLHYAARNGHEDTVAALLRYGAEPRARDSHTGETAADMAAGDDH